MKQKSRLLYLKQYLEENSDEQHPLTLAEIVEHIEAVGFVCGRKSIKADLDQLTDSGVDIVCNKSRELHYFVGDRHFELPELKMLTDAVQASKFIPARKSKQLISKLAAFASKHQAIELKRTLYTDKPVKSSNENIFYTVDLLHAAINTKTKITFKYYEYTSLKKKIYKHNKQNYIFSPYGLIWNSDNYYVVGYSDSHGKVSTFRVDRIASPKATEKPAVPKPNTLDMSVYARSVFQMFDGAERDVIIKCTNTHMKSVIDRFGEGVKTEVLDAEHFCIYVRVSASPTFYGWIFGFAGQMEIVAPKEVKNEYVSLARLVAEKAD